MTDKLLEILVGQLPEAIYFALFLLFTKELKTKRFLFILIISLEYVLLFHIFQYSVWAHFLFFIITFIVLKMVYKEKARLTDIFTLGIASIIMIVFNVCMYFIGWITFNYYPIYVVCTRVFIILFLIIFKNKLSKIDLIYEKLWNRNDKISKRMKSTTFRALNTVAFNVMFIVINVCMLFAIFLLGR